MMKKTFFSERRKKKLLKASRVLFNFDKQKKEETLKGSVKSEGNNHFLIIIKSEMKT